MAAAFLALALYGSLVPFHFRALPIGEVIDRFRTINYYQLGIESRSDWVANILLFIPLSFLAMASLCVDRRRGFGPLVAPIVVASCGAASLAIEFTQICFPPRTVSVNDIVAESIGGLLGTLLWLAWGQQITAWARRSWDASEAHGLAARLLPGYLAFLALIHLMPLDLTISPVEILRKFRDGRVHLIPFAAGWDAPLELLRKQAWNAVYYSPIGLLLAGLPGRAFRSERSWPAVLGLGLATAGLIEFLQLFVYTRHTDVTEVLTGGAAVLGSWWGLLAYRRPRPASGRRPAARVAPGRRPAPGTIFLLAWMGLLAFAQWQPFDFDADPARLAERFRRISWIPFSDYYRGTEYNAFDQFLHKALLFAPIGAVLASGRPRPPGASDGGRQAMLAGLALAVVLEAGQLFLPGRYPSVSDVLIECLGTWLGLAATRWARSFPRAQAAPNWWGS